MVRASDESRRKGTWSTEAGGPDFRGASESVIEGHRPNIGLDPGRRSSWPWVLGTFLLLVGGSVGATIFFWDDISSALHDEGESDGTSDGGEDTDAGQAEEGATQDAAATGDIADAAEESDAGVPGVDGSGSAGQDRPTGADSAAESGSASTTGGVDTTGVPHAWPPPGDQRFGDSSGASASGSADSGSADAGEATTAATSGTPPTGSGDGGSEASSAAPAVTQLELKVSGISTSRAEKNLGSLVEITTSCLQTALPDKGASLAGEISIRLSVKWNGRTSASSVSAPGMPSALASCIRAKLPKAGYPQPRPGKDGAIRATLKIGN